MADENKDEAPAPAETEAAPAGNKRKKLLLIAGAIVGVVAAGGGGAAYMMSGSGTEAEVAEAPAAGEIVDIPPMVVNLRTSGGEARYLKVHLMLVPGNAEPAAITARLPLIIDAYQPFLRELRPEDLQGSAATFRLKEEMLVRANAVAGPGSVRDVLIQDLVQQ